jgi:hypothetical protein
MFAVLPTALSGITTALTVTTIPTLARLALKSAVFTIVAITRLIRVEYCGHKFKRG